MKSMIQQKSNRIGWRVLRVSLICFLCLYPLINSFYGIDMGDTGIHFTNFKYLYLRREIVGFSTSFTSIIGNIWLYFFESLGLWGLNLLEVFVEWGISFCVYQWVKKTYGDIITLVGLCISSVISSTYLNIFNYHQFSVLLIILMMRCLYKGCMENNTLFTFLSSVIFVLTVFSRISSIVCVSLYLLYFLDGRRLDRKKYIVRHFMSAFFGAGISLLALVSFYKYTHIAGWVIKSVLKLKGMAETTSSTYSYGSIIRKFIVENVKTFASPILLLVACLGVFVLFEFIGKRGLICKILAILAGVIAVVLAKFSFDVNPVDGSPQFSTGPNFFFGVFVFSGIIYIIYLTYMKYSYDRIILPVMSVLLPLYIVFGSNTGTKHIIISSWLLVPLFIFLIKELYKSAINYVMINSQFKVSSVRIVFLFLISMLSIKTAHFFMVTNNFDSTKRIDITEPVYAENMKLLYTTKREAASLNGLYSSYKENEIDGQIIVFGSGVNIYALLDAEPYTRAWVTDPSFSAEDFEPVLQGCPAINAIVYCRTNQYFGYGEDNYDVLINTTKRDPFAGKKDILRDFLVRNGYEIKYQDLYYILFAKGNKPATMEEINSLFY